MSKITKNLPMSIFLHIDSEKPTKEWINNRNNYFREYLNERDDFLLNQKPNTYLYEKRLNEIIKIDLLLQMVIIQAVDDESRHNIHLPPELENYVDIKNLFSSDKKFEEYYENFISSSQELDNKVTKIEAFYLLKKLEDKNYEISKTDKLIILNKSFSNWSSLYLKNKFSNETFDKAFDELKLEGKLTYQQFILLTEPPSSWYEEKFINSFIYHCNHPKGRYYGRKNHKKFEANKTMTVNGERKKCFILLSP